MFVRKSLFISATTTANKLLQLNRIHRCLSRLPNPITQQGRAASPEKAVVGGESRRRKLKKRVMDNNDGSSNCEQRTALSRVVSNCVKRWFQDTLKEAKAGDVSMQILVGQMYFSGYGVPRDDSKGRLWMTRASRVRSSVWKVSNKRPGYNASDSDSDDQLNGDS